MVGVWWLVRFQAAHTNTLTHSLTLASSQTSGGGLHKGSSDSTPVSSSPSATGRLLMATAVSRGLEGSSAVSEAKPESAFLLTASSWLVRGLGVEGRGDTSPPRGGGWGAELGSPGEKGRGLVVVGDGEGSEVVLVERDLSWGGPCSLEILRLKSGDFFSCLMCGFGGGAGLVAMAASPGFLGGGAGLGFLLVSGPTEGGVASELERTFVGLGSGLLPSRRLSMLRETCGCGLLTRSLLLDGD